MMAGLPDIAGSYLGRFIAIETKMPGGGQPTPVQRLRAEQIRAAGGAVLSPCRSVAEAVAWLATRSRAAPASAMMNADDMRQITMFAHVINKLAIAKKEQAGVDLTSEEVSVLVTGIKLLIPKKKS
jgi:hypothetical protein